MRSRFPSVVACLAVWPVLAAAQSADRPVDFNRDIRPILSDNCFACHGPDENQRQVGLRLDTREGAFAPRGGSAVIVPGDRGKSRLYQRISAERKAMRMPPPAFNRTLTEKQIELMGRWIDQGAPWDTHWAYQPPVRPTLPALKDDAWPKNEIDHFVLARLEREGRRPSPEADKMTLIRRLTLDLTGLPPTPAEVDAFVADTSGEAYEKAVDRLLNSPRFGERMAMQWLDLARYADTHGYHIDSHRDMWPWRDWVIRAYNRNLPFDQFTIQQLAGDLLPGAQLDQKIATGFNRNHMINFEGGAIPEEYQNEYVVDRVEATSTVWMGMTMGCARCHDHKYDPISQKDFYRFYAFFNTIPEKGLDGRTGNAEPMAQLPSDPQKARLEELIREIRNAEEAMPEAEIDALQKEWEKAAGASLPAPPRDGLQGHYEFDGHAADTSGLYRHAKLVRGGPTYTSGTVARSAEFDGESHVTFPGVGSFDGTEKFTLTFWMRASGRAEMTLFQKLDGPDNRRGYEFLFDAFDAIGDLKRGAAFYFRMSHKWPENAIEIRTRGPIVQRDWYHVVLSSDGSGKASGLKLLLNGEPHDFEVVRDALSGSIANGNPVEIGNKPTGRPYRGQLDDLRFYDRLLTAEEIATLAVHLPVSAILAGDPAKRSKEEKEKLREYFLARHAPENLRELHSRRKTLLKEKAALDKIIPTVMVMEEMEKARETAVLGRGDYRNRGEVVTPAVPAIFPPLPGDAAANRLALARWLMDPAHPLTARVAVNRYWQTYFGTGLVKTAEDFGSQGEPPSHPELLDWLATEFVRLNWDVKAMQRLIVTSATYRQSSRATPELIEKDPENRLLARGPRFRLPAETIRDNALAASGLLYGKIGGPSVFPYQPNGLWDDTAYGDVFSAQTYTPSHGKDLYRRSMYTFWKRTVPPPALATFDAPDREKCTARRPITNTPLQALALMNDPTYVEAARALAQRMLKEAGSNAGNRIDHGYRLAAARLPEPRERQVLRDLAEQQTAHYRRDPNAAAALLRVGESKYEESADPAELAAWTAVASVILNLDEVITKE